MKSCFMCGAKYVKGHGLSFHRVPKDIPTKRKWLSAMGIDIHTACYYSVHTSVCSDHFAPDQFYITPSGIRCLKKGAVPQRSTEMVKRHKLGRTGQRESILQNRPAIDEKLTLPEENGENYNYDVPEFVDVRLPLSEESSKHSYSNEERLKFCSSLEATKTVSEVAYHSSSENATAPKKKRLSIQESQDYKKAASSSADQNLPEDVDVNLPLPEENSEYCIYDLPETGEVKSLLPENHSENSHSDAEQLTFCPSSEATETASEIAFYSSSEDAPAPRRLLIQESQHYEKSSPSSADTEQGLDMGFESSTTETASETENLIPRCAISNRLERLRYFGDIKLRDLRRPRTVKKSWSIILSTVASLKKKIQNLQRTNRRLKSRIVKMNTSMKIAGKQQLDSESEESTIESGAAEDELIS